MAAVCVAPLNGRAAGAESGAVDADVPAEAMVILRPTIHSRIPLDAVFAADVRVDGAVDSQMLVLPGSSPVSLVGPLAQGRHTFTLRPSDLWPWPAGTSVEHVRADIVSPGDPRYAALRWAPRIGLRSDTIGGRNDLPLLMYVEQEGVRLRYSALFSNEDGGTPTRALMARWGRTTDIEWVCEAELAADGSLRAWTFQGPEHETRRVAPPPQSPSLVVSSLNNIFLPAGRSTASVRLVPRLVDLREATRESVMDGEPWTYAVMARELSDENKIAGDGKGDATTVSDPRAYLYAEARLKLRHAVVAAWAETQSGLWRSSHQGRRALAVTREGWIRTAVERGTADVRAVAWECLPADDEAPSDATCDIEVARVFTLDADYRPGTTRVAPRALQLRAGEMVVVPLLPLSRSPAP